MNGTTICLDNHRQLFCPINVNLMKQSMLRIRYAYLKTYVILESGKWTEMRKKMGLPTAQRTDISFPEIVDI